MVAMGAATAPLGCGSQSSAEAPAVVFDPCAPLALIPDAAATPAEIQALAAGLALWNSSAGTALALGMPASGAPSLPVTFQAAAAPFHGLYDAPDGQVFLNRDLTGNDLSIAAAHEIGHAFGLVHVSPDARASLMNPDNLSVPPTAADVATLNAAWGRCGPLDATGAE